MAKKPRSQWTEAYRKRIERGEAKGLSRQAARGKKPQENKARKRSEQEREKRGETVTTSHKTAIKRYLARIKNPKGYDVVLEAVQERGWSWFQGVRNARNAMTAQARAGKSLRGAGYYEGYIDELDLMEDELEFLLYYHD